MSANYYITTTLPYVNAEPHIGFALEIIQADALARYHRLLGDTVIFNTGTDEHGLKIFRKATEAGIDPKIYCDEYAAKFGELKNALNLSYTNFIRTTDAHHSVAAQDFWRICAGNGDIYKKKYKIKYCVGCELEKTDSELENDRCPVHPTLDIEFIEEENYFFRFSRYQQPLLDLYAARPDFVVPKYRLEEIKKFVERGLEDFSISRLKSKMPWGVPVPDDETQVMYVWFDALINYISTLGRLVRHSPPTISGDEEGSTDFEKFWPGVQIAGKDNLRQQSAMWQAMLLSAVLMPSRQIFIHGFITANGEKMSKSLGNTVNPIELTEKYGRDAVRWYLLGAVPSFEDGDFTISRFEEIYTADLVNGIGNFTSRVLTMIEKYCGGKVPPIIGEQGTFTAHMWTAYDSALVNYDFNGAVSAVKNYAARLDRIITEKAPWKTLKENNLVDSATEELFYELCESLRHIGMALLPIAPDSGEKILSGLGIDFSSVDFLTDRIWGNYEFDAILKKGDPLFPRLKK